MTTNASLQLQAWTNAVGAEAAQAVADVVVPLATSPFTPKPLAGCAAKALERALALLGMPPAPIATASVSDPGRFAAGLPPNGRHFAELRPHDLLARAIFWRMATPFDEELDARLGPILREAAGDEWSKRLRGRLWLDLVRRPSQDGRNRDGELGMMIMQVRWAAASFLAGYASLGETAAVVPALRLVLELIRLGNVPVGRLASGEFLVVTA